MTIIDNVARQMHKKWYIYRSGRDSKDISCLYLPAIPTYPDADELEFYRFYIRDYDGHPVNINSEIGFYQLLNLKDICLHEPVEDMELEEELVEAFAKALLKGVKV